MPHEAPLIIRKCALPRCTKTWRTVESSPNRFHNESCRKSAELEPAGSEPYLLAFEELEAKKHHDPRRPAVTRKQPKRVVDDYVADTLLGQVDDGV